jgi:uncharacterized protein DUF3800
VELGDECFWDPTEQPLIGTPNPGVKRWWFSCDESGTGGQRYYGFGTLVMPDQRRGDFSALIKSAMRDTGFNPANEFKWNRINGLAEQFYMRIVDDFFKTNYLAFHCIVFDTVWVNVPPYDADPDLQLRIRLHKFLTNKIQRCLHLFPDREQTFRIWIDPIPSSYRKADEALHIIANNALHKVRGVKPIDRVIERDSKKSPSIELCDVLLGGVLSAWEQNITSRYKLAVQARIAQNVGWPDLRHDTWPSQRKLNVWLFQDPRERKFHDTRGFLVA